MDFGLLVKLAYGCAREVGRLPKGLVEDSMKKEFRYDTNLETVKRVLVPMFYKESLVGLSIGKGNRAFKAELFNSILQLAEKVDNATLTNQDIREKIREIVKETNVSVGQAQKVINVYLKYYCILRDKAGLIKELDCPIDEGIAELVWKGLSTEEKEDLGNCLGLQEIGASLNFTFFKEITKLKNMDYRLYEILQEQLEKIGSGIRLKPDLEIYDKGRIEGFVLL